MNKTAFVILALLSILFSGCAINSIPPEKQKDFALIKAGEFPKSITDLRASISKIDETIVLDMINSGRDVLPGKHNVKVNSCVRASCTDYSYIFEAQAGFTYILEPRKIQVIDRFTKIKVDTLQQKDFRSSNYFPSKEIEQYLIEVQQLQDVKLKKKEEAEVADLAAITERRTRNLPLVRKIGAKICQEKTESEIRPRYNNPFVYVYVGYVESISEDKVQIRISDAYRKSPMPSQKSRPDGFSSSIIWDSPLNWDLCE